MGITYVSGRQRQHVHWVTRRGQFLPRVPDRVEGRYWWLELVLSGIRHTSADRTGANGRPLLSRSMGTDERVLEAVELATDEADERDADLVSEATLLAEQ